MTYQFSVYYISISFPITLFALFFPIFYYKIKINYTLKQAPSGSLMKPQKEEALEWVISLQYSLLLHC